VHGAVLVLMLVLVLVLLVLLLFLSDSTKDTSKDTSNLRAPPAAVARDAGTHSGLAAAVFIIWNGQAGGAVGQCLAEGPESKVARGASHAGRRWIGRPEQA
jgi:hypothetical protein